MACNASPGEPGHGLWTTGCRRPGEAIDAIDGIEWRLAETARVNREVTMRRRLAAPAGALALTALTALTALIALTALSGCAADLPDGVDGDLTNGWRPLPAAVQFRPADGVCHAKLVETAPQETDDSLPCSERHVAETFAVGELTGATTMTSSGDGLPQAYAGCTKQAAAFLGGDWRTGWLIMQPVLPGAAGWQGGARWYRCDATETSPVDGRLVSRTGSLNGSMRAGGKLRMSCANPTIDGEQVSEMHPVACGSKHTAEFAGLWTTKYRSSSQVTSAAMAKGCDATIAGFAGIPDDADIESRVGWLGFPPDDTSWQLGDHAVRCFLWLNGEKMTGSYRNAGTAKLKIHYVNR
jgi:hypothetical protein